MISTGGIDLKSVLNGSGILSATTRVSTSGTADKNSSTSATTSAGNGITSIGSSILEALSSTGLTPPAGGGKELTMTSLAQSLADLDFTMPSRVQDQASGSSTSNADSLLASTSSPSLTTKEAPLRASSAELDKQEGNSKDLKDMPAFLSSTNTGQKGLSFTSNALKSYSLASEPEQPVETGARLKLSI